MYALTGPAADDVFVLGAGFSKAISAVMPLTDALGNAVLIRLGEHRPPVSPFSGGYFEAWLSRIGEDQPDLSVAENLANRTLFQRCSDALAEELLEAHTGVSAAELAAPWLQRFLRILHARRATVVTFNQDLLFELAVEQAHLSAWDQSLWPVPGPQPSVSWHHVLDLRPPLPAGHLEEEPLPTLRLLKLHGSANWYWRPGDQSGTSVVRWLLPGTVPAREAVPDEAAARRRAMPGRVPMIVPPAAAKSSYYQAPIITQLWQETRQALQQAATRLYVVGYSLPITDLVTSGMLREAAFAVDRPDPVPVIVVNPDPDTVAERLRQLGAAPQLLRTIESVESFVDEYEQQAAHDVVTQLRALQPTTEDALLLVGTGVISSDKVVGLEFSPPNGTVFLHVEDHPGGHQGITVQAPGAQRAMTVADLLMQLREPGMRRLAVKRGNRPYEATIIAAAAHQTNLGAGNGNWQVLIPSTPLPD